MNSENTSTDNESSRADPPEGGRFVAILPIIAPRLIPLGITFFLGATIATAGWLFWSPPVLSGPTEPQQDSAPELPQPNSIPVSLASDEEYARDILGRPISEALAHVDEVFLSADLDTALMLYEKLLENGDGQHRQDLQYRVAACSELMGTTDRALKIYQELIAETDPTHLHLAAKIGIARTKARAGEFRSARIHLCETVLHLPHESNDDQFRGEVCHLLAYCNFQSDAHKAADLLDDDGLAVVAPPWTPRHFLRLGKQPRSNPEPKSNEISVIKVVHQFGQKPSQIHVQVM